MILLIAFFWIHDQKTQLFETKVHSHGIPGSEALETPSSSINCDGEPNDPWEFGAFWVE